MMLYVSTLKYVRHVRAKFYEFSFCGHSKNIKSTDLRKNNG